jgi:hypothetical protein
VVTDHWFSASAELRDAWYRLRYSSAQALRAASDLSTFRLEHSTVMTTEAMAQ